MSGEKQDDKKVAVLLIGPSHNGSHDERVEVSKERAAELVENHLARYAE